MRVFVLYCPTAGYVAWIGPGDGSFGLTDDVSLACLFDSRAAAKKALRRMRADGWIYHFLAIGVDLEITDEERGC